MTKPIPVGIPPVGLSNTPYYVQNRKNWAIEQERYRHDQGLFSLGEYALFVLMWKVEDFHHGLVGRCNTCYGNPDALLASAAAAYNQPKQNRCPDCFGTTFEGGFRARIVRPGIFTDTDDNESQSEHGVVYSQRVSVESTSDFRFRDGDYAFRIDGSRWQITGPSRVQVRTGFEHPDQQDDSMGYSVGMAGLENRSSVAYMIPPLVLSDLQAMLVNPGKTPYAMPFQDLKGPLIPPAWTD